MVTRRRIRNLAYLAIGLLLCTGPLGCSDDDGPAETVRDSLGEAEDALDEMRSESEALREEIEDRAARVRDLAEKHVKLLTAQLEALESEVAGLPADAETAFRNELESLRSRRDAVETTLEEYLAAAGENADALHTEFKKKIAELDNAFEDFRARLAEALRDDETGAAGD